jgi:hypothetical protein
MPYKTKYKPENPQKYSGNVDNIVCRSLWERKFCKYLDLNENVIRWASEEIKIPYISTIDKKVHNYYPDFVFEAKDIRGSINTYMVEIKPKKQTSPPVMRKSKRSFLQESVQFEINTCKWKAATIFCKNKGWIFKILTEENIFK